MALIALRGKYAVGRHRFAIVDDDLAPYLSRWKWKAKPNGAGNNVYAVRNQLRDGVTKNVWMHREVLGVKYDGILDIDHINHNALDNRKVNLRLVSRSVNVRNARTVVVTGKCKHCLQPFQRPVKAVSVAQIKYCSEQCSKKAQRARVSSTKVLRDASCKECGKAFSTYQSCKKFCCSRCCYRFRDGVKKYRTTTRDVVSH